MKRPGGLFCFFLSINALAFGYDWSTNPGDGSVGNPYQISTAEELASIGSDSNLLDKHFILTNDIDLDPAVTGMLAFTTAVIAPDTGPRSEFQGTPFTGVFDGNDRKITNLTIDSLTDWEGWSFYLGLFGQINSGGEVKNLGIENCSVTGQIGCVYVGGLCASHREGTISGCYTTGSVFGGVYVGGLCGENYEGTICNCYATANVTGDMYVGGLCGGNAGTIYKCWATGSVTRATYSSFLGGLCGENDKGTISDCYATASVSGDDELGGLCGLNDEGTISDCYATGSVTGGDGSWLLGGLCGVTWGGTISNCYAAGRVTSGDDSEYLGGLCGDNPLGGTISNCFWDIDTSGLGTSDGGTGLSTAQMQEASTYLSAGWDFVGETINGPNDIWTIKEGFDYPRHVWKIVNFVGWDGVDFKDYRFFAEQWGQTGCSEVNDCSSTDLDFSGSVDSNDLRIFTTYWLSGK